MGPGCNIVSACMTWSIHFIKFFFLIQFDDTIAAEIRGCFIK